MALVFIPGGCYASQAGKGAGWCWSKDWGSLENLRQVHSFRPVSDDLPPVFNVFFKNMEHECLMFLSSIWWDSWWTMWEYGEVCNRTSGFSIRDYDGKVTPEEVAAAAMFLKDSLDKESVHELIANLAKDSGLVSILIFLMSLAISIPIFARTSSLRHILLYTIWWWFFFFFSGWVLCGCRWQDFGGRYSQAWDGSRGCWWRSWRRCKEGREGDCINTVIHPESTYFFSFSRYGFFV